jgi:hypothetical protein
LRDNTKSKISEEKQKKFLRFLNTCKVEKNMDGNFFIPKNQAAMFLSQYSFYAHSNSDFFLPRGRKKRIKTSIYYGILLRISEKEIDLGSDEIYSKGIMERMCQKLVKNFITRNIPLSETNKLQTTTEFIEDVTKITQLLLVVAHSLFRDDEQDPLRRSDFEQDVKFLKTLWFDLEAGKFEKKEGSWEMEIHRILNLQTDDNTSCKWVGKREDRHSFSFKILNYWIAQNGIYVKDKNGEN